MSKNTRRRRTIARHGQLRTPGPVSQLLAFIAIGLSVVLVSGLAVVGYIAYDLTSTVSANAVELDGQKELPPDISEYEGGFKNFKRLYEADNNHPVEVTGRKLRKMMPWLNAKQPPKA